MSSTIARFLTIMIELCIIFTPILGYVDSLNNAAVEQALTAASKEASIDGEFSADIVKEMKDTLSADYNFNKDEIQFTGTQTVTPRGEYIQGQITVPRGIIFVLDIFNQGPKTITKKVQIMSEHIDQGL